MVQEEGFRIMIFVDVLSGGVSGGTSIMYAALGETVSERAGVINLGTEGCMLMGAFAGFAVTSMTGSPWLGMLAAAAAGGALALIHAILVVSRKANQFASGLSLLFLALGLTALYGSGYVGQKINAFDPIAIPGLSSIPIVGPIFFEQNILTYISYFVAPLMWFVIFRTRIGLMLRTAGERSEVLTVNGYSVVKVRYIAVVTGGIFAGIGGAYLSVAYSQSWFENMIIGRGFIAVALVVFAAWDPLKVIGGAYLFGSALALSPVLQANGYEINQFALDMLPFVLTLLLLVFLGKRAVNSSPAELRRVFDNARA
ncbi:MAG TPA: ABC transporter permease [Actinobacteria bacterium]|nr:ABC transporter permease [Actinomycetota bacterium]